MSVPTEIEKFAELIRTAHPSIKIEFDRPANPDGEWWIDMSIGDVSIAVSWTGHSGFGVYAQSDGAYGDRPTELYRNAERAASRVNLFFLEGTAGHEMSLSNLRSLTGIGQLELAERIGVKQSAISKLENRGEVKLGTITTFVEALGGKLEVRCHFPDFDALIVVNRSEVQMRPRPSRPLVQQAIKKMAGAIVASVRVPSSR